MRINRGERGFSLLEMLATLSLMGVLSAIAVSNIKELDDPLKNATAEAIGFMKQVRARAISTTSAYEIYPTSTTSIVTRYSNACSDAVGDKTADPKVVLGLPDGAFLSDTNWSICFSSRGFPDGNIQIVMEDNDGEDRTVEIYLGGAVKEVE